MLECALALQVILIYMPSISELLTREILACSMLWSLLVKMVVGFDHDVIMK
jgi:hypothetical protein